MTSASRARGASSRRLRGAGALWILAALIWLPIEDTVVWVAGVLATGGCLWLWWRFFDLLDQTWKAFAAGALLGLAMPLFTLFLMAVKSGLHGHGFADFTAGQVLGVLNLIPIALIVGAISGLANVLIRRKIVKM